MQPRLRYNGMKSSLRHLPLLVLLCAQFALTPSYARAEIIGDILRVGFPIASESGSAVRHGSWTPVLVDLRLENQASFDGVLRLRQYDRDGDVYVDTVPVHLFAEGGAQQRYWMYTVTSKPANPNATDEHIRVELFATESEDDPGKLAKVVSGGGLVSAMEPPVEPEFMAPDHNFILDVSERAMGKIRELRSLDIAYTFDRPIRLAHLAPGDLPNKWFGLDSVDCIVWDDADTSAITEQQELALVQWVQHGGTLVLAAARTASVLAQSTHIGPLLPTRIGAVQPVTHLPDVRAQLMNSNDEAARYTQPVAIARCEPINDPTVVNMLTDSSIDGVVLSKRRVGRGQIVFLAASINDLLSDSKLQPVEFFRRLLELRRSAISAEDQGAYVELFRDVDPVVGFLGVSGARLAVAILFCMTYVLLATFGVWRLLHGRKMLKHSWTALAIVAACASVLSIIGVQSVHGIGRTLHQLSIVDGTANAVQATGTAYFGLTTSTKSTLDVWLPSDSLMNTEPGPSSCVLYPMHSLPRFEMDDVAFTDPARYRILPTTAEVCDVPFRATLKQFEGRWQGTLPGMLSSSVASTKQAMPVDDKTLLTRSEDIIAEGSWIQNSLGVDLDKCYLIFAPRDLYSPQKFSNPLQQRTALDEARAIPLGSIPDGQRVDLFNKIYMDELGQPIPMSNRKSRSLASIQNRWGRHLASAADRANLGSEAPKERFNLNLYENSVLIATILSEIDPTSFKKTAYSGYPTFSRARCRQLDMSYLLSSRSAIFVGFSEDPGPIRLATRSSAKKSYERISPEKAWTVYRFVVPIEVR